MEKELFFKTWDDFGVKVPNHITSGQFSTTCPICSHLRKPENRKKPCLTVNLDTLYFKCHNNGCEKYGYIRPTSGMKEYQRPEVIKPRDIENPIGLSWVDYFLKRGISINTLMKLKVITTAYKFPQNEFSESEAVVFPYYKDERLLFYKYRGLKKEFAMSKAPELIFWNIDSMITTRSQTVKDVIICEGEIDVLSWVEAGFERVISVPNGANLKASVTTYPYIDNTITYFDNIETIYISTDSDEAGKKLKEDLCRRMGRDRCKIIELPEGCKDANDVLKLEKGKERLVKAFENADWYPMDGVFTLSGDVEEEYEALMRGDVPSYKSLGWKPVDELVKFNNGDALTLVSGAPGSAKSQFALEIAVRQSIIHGMKWVLFSNESGSPAMIFQLLAKILTGMRGSDKENWDIPIMSKDVHLYIKGFIKSHFIIVDDVDLKSFKFSDFLELCEKQIKRHGISGVIADPFNNFENAFNEFDQTMAISLNATLTKAKKFCKSNNIHLIIVPHPAKLEGAMKSSYQISGGSAWFNKPDSIIFLNRQADTADYKNGLGDDIEIVVDKIKKNFAGKKGTVTVKYHVATGRFGYEDDFGVVKFDNYQSLNALKASQSDIEPFIDPFENIDPLPQVMPKADFKEMSIEDAEIYF